MDSLASILQILTQQREIPVASPEFLGSAKNPNIRNFPPNRQPQFVSPALQSLYNAPGAAIDEIGDMTSSLANFLGVQLKRPETAVRDAVSDNFITRAQNRTTTAIRDQTL